MVRREFRRNITGELETVERAVREFAATIRDAVSEIGDALAEARGDAVEEGTFAAEIRRWAEKIPLKATARSRRSTVTEVRNLVPVLAVTRRPDDLAAARDASGTAVLPVDLTLELAALISAAVFEALGVDPDDLVHVPVKDQPAPAPAPQPHPDGLADKAKRCIETAEHDVEEALGRAAKRGPSRSAAQRARELLAEAGAQLEHGDYAAALDTCESARAAARNAIDAADEETGGKTTSS